MLTKILEENENFEVIKIYRKYKNDEEIIVLEFDDSEFHYYPLVALELSNAIKRSCEKTDYFKGFKK